MTSSARSTETTAPRLERVRFGSRGDRLVGHVTAQPARGPRPAVVLCCGFGGTQDIPSMVAAAPALADAGYLALTFDYRGFAASDGQPRQVVSIAGQLEDVRDAVAYVRGRADVDPDRVLTYQLAFLARALTSRPSRPGHGADDHRDRP
jgi:alpha/beta superfamily hydrolase